MYALFFDFDRTIAQTFAPSPHGIGVAEAYQLAIIRVFGESTLALYQELGGLANRSPSQLVNDLIKLVPSLEAEAMKRIEPDAPRGLIKKDAESVIAEMLVRFKMEILLAEINEDWPKPCPGFLTFAKTMRELSQDGITLEPAIITAGHRQFIKKTSRVWGIVCPRVMVTDEDIRWRKRPADVQERVKPAIFPFKLAVAAWQHQCKQELDPSKIVYFGDDREKDGGLARNAGVLYGWINNGSCMYEEVAPFPAGSFEFSDWEIVAEFLTQRADLLRQGLPWTEIFSSFR